ncbi:MAG TPA: ABC transporter ATP-binding protein [Acidimicrobiales bacterium]|nr:ABC transporter ATP-binding protein [Acidimicrobiales bacterium]
MAVLELDNLAVDLRVGRALRRVVHDVSFPVTAGEAVGLVGESGAGKSMTSRAVIRLLPEGARVHGDIAMEGRSIPAMGREELRAYRLHDVAMIFQDPRAHVNPVRRIGDFLTEALLERGDSRERAVARVSDLLVRVGIHDPERRMGQYPHELSGGLLQRVMIAAALAIEPKLLLADEPTTALDVTTQSDVMVHLDTQRRERGLAMIFVTHDLELAIAVCDRIAVMYAGHLVEDSPAPTLHEEALHPYTKGLLASRPNASVRRERLAVIPGRPLSAFEVAQGCVFASRCSFAEERCLVERPLLRRLGHARVACHRAEELGGSTRRYAGSLDAHAGNRD